MRSPPEFDWVAHAEAVVADILGEPNENMSRPPDDVRFGNNGSVSVNYTSGIWHDFENERGGGIKDLIRICKEIDDRETAIAYAEECLRNFENGGKPTRKSGNGKQDGGLCYEIEAIHSYQDASGQVAFEVVRLVNGSHTTNADGKRAKAFFQRRPSGESDQSWLRGLDAGEYMRPAPNRYWVKFNATKFEQYPAATRQRKVFNSAAPVVPYQLPDLLKAVASGQTICIAEGEKKVDLIRSFGFPATCCAGGAKKWRPEHSAYLKGADIVLLPDNDPPGREHVEAIAASLPARRIRILDLPDLPEKGDVVDWHAAGGGAEEFARLIAAASDYIPDEVAGPQPLMRPLPPPEPFPFEALGPELASAAQAICDIIQSPFEMCASAVLASTSFAVSAHVNIKTPTGQARPTSCWFWCVADSGGRKTFTDKEAFASQMQHERQLRIRQNAEIEAYNVRKTVWEAQKKAIEKQFRNPGEAGSAAHQIELGKLGPEPEKPLESLIMASNFTFEGLVNCLNLGQPLYGIIGSEGGQFIGGHGMTNEAKLNTIANLCAAWDGVEPIKRVRAKEITMLYGRRVGMHLMVQPGVAAIALADELLAEQGFMARILVCEPTSLIGTRLHKDPPPGAGQIMQRYRDRILKIMESPYPLAPDTRNELEPRDVPFSEGATALFWAFADEAEKQMAPGGEYEMIRAFASKLAEHAARLGATIAAYRDLDFTELAFEDFQRGMQIAVYYATEAKRLSKAGTISSELIPVQQLLPPAQKLLDWLRYVWTKPTVTARTIYTFGPYGIRNRESAIALAKILVEHDHITPIKTNRADRLEWQINRRACATS